jgi:hypothetical protein
MILAIGYQDNDFLGRCSVIKRFDGKVDS